mgnify:CR=1 FL=1
MEITILGFLVNLAALIGIAVKLTTTFERRMTLMETRLNGHKDLQEEQLKTSRAQLAELAMARKECEQREIKRLEDHEARLRELKEMAHIHAGQ